ncbi:hypothetical protein PRZ48_007032 [Zasmidium cellare]|uniref:Uncharacterized protein n=1 Tax=Zasmidium cellare TaxID=395010 RepID=A0ABR0EJ90_ZASCE|nr:hypothetical protein PRZ48_007032 [Zasmidium cellare]
MSSSEYEYVPEDEQDEDVKVEEGETPKTRKSAKGPEKDQLVLLCIEYIVGREGVELDWDLVAKEVEPYCTGEAIKQHLSKLRAARLSASQKNPPKLTRKTIINARKKGNPLLDTSKTPKTPKRRVRKDSAHGDESDGEEEPPKPGPKTTSLLHLTKTRSKATPRKRKVKQEPEDDMGCLASKPTNGDDAPARRAVAPARKKKKAPKPTLPPNFPEESTSPAPPIPPAVEPALPADDGGAWSTGVVWHPQNWAASHEAGGGDEGIVPLQRARGGTYWEPPPPGLTFGGDGALPDPFRVEEDLALPSSVGGDPSWDTLLDGEYGEGDYWGM